MALVSAPQLSIPASDNTCKVSIIDTSCRMKTPAAFMLMPSIPELEYAIAPSLSFLVENVALGQRVLFDLGVRKDWENGSPAVVNMIQGSVSLHFDSHARQI